MRDDVRADLVALLAWWNAQRGAPADAGLAEFLRRAEAILEGGTIRIDDRALTAAATASPS